MIELRCPDCRITIDVEAVGGEAELVCQPVYGGRNHLVRLVGVQEVDELADKIEALEEEISDKSEELERLSEELERLSEESEVARRTPLFISK
jgi:vacuolar-type H+-ATPase subunit I/STV1